MQSCFRSVSSAKSIAVCTGPRLGKLELNRGFQTSLRTRVEQVGPDPSLLWLSDVGAFQVASHYRSGRMHRSSTISVVTVTLVLILCIWRSTHQLAWYLPWPPNKRLPPTAKAAKSPQMPRMAGSETDPHDRGPPLLTAFSKGHGEDNNGGSNAHCTDYNGMLGVLASGSHAIQSLVNAHQDRLTAQITMRCWEC